MTTRAQQARLFNEAIAQGLSEEQALRVAGITNPDEFSISDTGQLQPTALGPPRRPNETIVRPGASIDAGDDDDDDDDRRFVTRPVSSSTTTTSQTTVTGGSVTTRAVTPTTYRNTAESQALQGQANTLAAQKEARAAELRAQGKSGAQVLRDPEYRRLSQEAQNTENAAQDARAVDQAGTVTTSVAPGPTSTQFSQTVDQGYLTQRTAGEDQNVETQQVNRLSTSGETPRAFSAAEVSFTQEELNAAGITNIPAGTPIIPSAAAPGAVSDTGGVPTQTLANLQSDTGAQRAPSPVTVPDGAGQGFVFDPETGELIPGDSADAEAIVAEQRRVENFVPATPNRNLSAAFDPETQTYGVWDNDTGVFVQTGLTEQEATLAAQDGSFEDRAPSIENFEPEAVSEDPQALPNGTPFDDDGNLNPGWTLDGDGNPVYVGDDFVDPSLTASAEASRQVEDAAIQAATLERARVQAILANQIRQADQGDWRLKIRLAPGAKYLYRGDDGNGGNAGILAPLNTTDGVIFPYTPSITTAYRARYNEQDLPHSNYRGYFYSGSNLEEINIQATFTAQDTQEANYLLAVIHFFRSVTKMFYGQNDAFRGAPPPVVFLQGFGTYQFNRNPCVVSSFNYNLPADVDYIRADVPPISGLAIQQQRRPGGQTPQSLPTNVFQGALARLKNAGLAKGGVFRPPDSGTLGTVTPTYVPTKIDMTLTLLPMQTRQQVSQEFSLNSFANGELVKKGFW